MEKPQQKQLTFAADKPTITRSIAKPVQSVMRIPMALNQAGEFELVRIHEDGSEWPIYSHYPSYEMVKRIYDDLVKNARDDAHYEMRGYA